MTDLVEFSISNSVAVLSLNRPDVRNAINDAMRNELIAHIERAAAEDGIRALVLTGNGKSFCSGGDISGMRERLKAPAGEVAYNGWRRQKQIHRAVGALHAFPKPTIAAVNGVAYAGGFLLAQQCDLVVAAEHAAFAVTEVRVGRGAPWAAPLPWLVGPRAAAEILLIGEPVSAARAYEIGLVNRVVPAAELHERAQELAERIAANAPLSVAAAKRTVYLSAPAAEADAIWEPVYRSADAQEGPRAFREKRNPVWKGQ